MSQRTIELHSRAVAAVNAGEVPAELLAPGFFMENRVSAVTDQHYRGVDGWRAWMDDIFEMFADGATYDVEELIAASDEYVVARFCVSGTGVRSGMPLEFRWIGVTWFEGGKATRAIGYPSRADALQAVGLDG